MPKQYKTPSDICDRCEEISDKVYPVGDELWCEDCRDDVTEEEIPDGA